MKINIIGRDNGVGLTQDVLVLKSALIGHEINVIKTDFSEVKGKMKVVDKSSVKSADINIFSEHILTEELYKYGKRNVLIPNAEWFNRLWLSKLDNMTEVWCKTRDAERIFSELGCKTEFISFTSQDRFRNIKKKNVFLHLAGKSETKGTYEMLLAWDKDMPTLVFCKNNTPQNKMYNVGGSKEQMLTPNIKKCFSRIDYDDLLNLSNICQFHVCPSQYEGFGHYINEARSVGAIIISNDSPPMDDILSDEYAFLCKPESYKPMNLAKIAIADPKEIKEAVKKCVSLSEKEIKRMSKASRQAFLDNDKFFKQRILEVL